MPANPIDTAAYHRVLRLSVDGTRARRYSRVEARRRWYATSRRERYARYLSGLAR